MSEEQNGKPLAFGVRAFATDIQYFKSLYPVKFPNQQLAFADLIAAHQSTAGVKSEFVPKRPTDYDNLEHANAANAELTTMLANGQQEIDKGKALLKEAAEKLAEISQNYMDAMAALKNPRLVELDDNAIIAMRRIRPFVIKTDFIKDPKNYPNEFATMAVKQLINTEYSKYLK